MKSGQAFFRRKRTCSGSGVSTAATRSLRVLAGSNHVGARVMCTPHVIWPSGAAAAGDARATRASAIHATSPRGRIGDLLESIAGLQSALPVIESEYRPRRQRAEI